LESDKWQGPAVLHLLQAEDKRATKRQVTIDKEGYFRTKEGGYYFRLMKTEAGLTLAYSTEESHSSVPVQIRRSGPMLVIYDSLEKPKLLAIVQLDARVEEKRPGAEKP
jgi:uncharacterized protein YigE (DUF2233 family)